MSNALVHWLRDATSSHTVPELDRVLWLSRLHGGVLLNCCESLRTMLQDPSLPVRVLAAGHLMYLYMLPDLPHECTESLWPIIEDGLGDEEAAVRSQARDSARSAAQSSRAAASILLRQADAGAFVAEHEDIGRMLGATAGGETGVWAAVDGRRENSALLLGFLKGLRQRAYVRDLPLRKIEMICDLALDDRAEVRISVVKLLAVLPTERQVDEALNRLVADSVAEVRDLALRVKEWREGQQPGEPWSRIPR